MNEIMNKVLWGNKVVDYTLVIGGILLSWIILKLFRRRLFKLIRKIVANTKTNFDDLLFDLAEKFVIPYIYLLINYNIITSLYLTQRLRNIGIVAFSVITVYFVVRAINFIIHQAIVVYMERQGESPERIKQLNGMLVVVKILMWGMGIVMLADNLGYDITTIIAGFGIGGIAIALAAQSILGDLFSYLVIFFDKPFEIGDFIIVGENSGIVEKIGIKTSHVRSLDGQQLIMLNAEMAKSVIQNFKRLERRRIVFSIGVVYYTSSAKLKKIPELINNIIEKQKLATYDRVHLKSFGDFSINFEIVYYVESADYLTYMNIHHEICLNIFERFEKETIDFAFPTQTIFVNNQNEETDSEKKNFLVTDNGHHKEKE